LTLGDTAPNVEADTSLGPIRLHDRRAAPGRFSLLTRLTSRQFAPPKWAAPAHLATAFARRRAVGSDRRLGIGRGLTVDERG
jgi:hypothetical protein